MAGGIRRVVVGTDEAGRTTVHHDGPAQAVTSLPAVPGTSLTDLWRSDVVPLPAVTADDPTAADFALMPPGSLFRIIDLAPTGDAEPMWHQTPAVDLIAVTAGSVTFLHEGGEVALAAGDTIVVGGVRHAWVNRTDAVCRLVDVSIALADPPT